MRRLQIIAIAFIGVLFYSSFANARFLQTDPIFYEDQMNMYTYVANDPTNKVDPSGEVAVIVKEVVKAAAKQLAKKQTKEAAKEGAKKGAANGSRAGKKHTRAAVKKAKANNAAKNGGTEKCESCGKPTTKPTKRTKGSKVNPREGQGDHVHPRSKGGDGATVNDQRNIDIKCSECNLKKTDNLP